MKCAAAAVCVTVAFLRLGTFAAADDAPSGVDHVGVWSCVLFGNPALGNERVLLRFEPGGATAIARAAETGFRAWGAASQWQVSDATLSFGDPRTGRRFTGDLTRSSLGGTWQTRTLVGGWWCSSAAAEALAGVSAADDSRAAFDTALSLPPLLPMVMATPNYPREAIRAAKEGRAVVCFVVDAEGRVLEPEVIELSDEVFRAPSLDSLSRSRYGGWDDEALLRPGCRTFIYRLDAVD